MEKLKFKKEQMLVMVIGGMMLLSMAGCEVPIEQQEVKEERSYKEIDPAEEPIAYLTAYVDDKHEENVQVGDHKVRVFVDTMGDVVIRRTPYEDHVSKIILSENEGRNYTYGLKTMKGTDTIDLEGHLDPAAFERGWVAAPESMTEKSQKIVEKYDVTAEDMDAEEFTIILDGLNVYLESEKIPITLADLGFTSFKALKDLAWERSEGYIAAAYSEEELANMTAEETEAVYEMFNRVYRFGEYAGEEISIYTWDENGFPIMKEMKMYNDDDLYMSSYTYEYEYDDKGNLIHEKVYEPDLIAAMVGRELKKDTPNTEILYFYDEDGNEIRKEEYQPIHENMDGEIYKTVLEKVYDKKGALTEIHWKQYKSGDIEHMEWTAVVEEDLITHVNYKEYGDDGYEMKAVFSNTMNEEGKIITIIITDEETNEGLGAVHYSYDSNGICTVTDDIDNMDIERVYAEATGVNLFTYNEIRMDPNGHTLYEGGSLISRERYFGSMGLELEMLLAERE